MGVHCETILGDNVTEKVDAGLAEVTLAQFAEELMLAEESENLAKMALVVSESLAVYKDVVQIDDDELVQKVMEHIVHQSHESGQRVSKAERKNKKLIVSELSAKSSLGHVLWYNSDLVVA